jgi:hypothetical protein
LPEEEIMNNTSKTDWARIDAMTDDEIDTSDIPPLTDEFFAKAKLRIPASKIQTVHIRKYIADLEDEAKWESSFQRSRPNLVAAARQANQEIAEGKSVPMDYDRL